MVKGGGRVKDGKKGMDKGGGKGGGIWQKQVWLYVGKKGGGLMVGKRREGYGWRKEGRVMGVNRVGGGGLWVAKGGGL